MADKKNSWKLNKKNFGPLWPYIKDPLVSDVDLDGDALWVDYVDGRRLNLSFEELGIDSTFVENFAQSVANSVGQKFNETENVLTAETEVVRMVFAKDTLVPSGTCFSIRKSMPCLRFTATEALKEGYCSKELMAFLINCVVSRTNMAFVGEPGHGKTECAKFCSSFIPKFDKVITVEDVMEWHYKTINPGKRADEIKVKSPADYSKGIALALRFNPSWLMLAEARSSEILNLIEGWSTGVHGMTTLHCGDVRLIPDRAGNMVDATLDKQTIINNVYQYLDLGILLKKEYDKDGKLHRRIKQVGVFERINGKNECYVIYEDGKFEVSKIPKSLLKKLKAAGIQDPLHSDQMNQRLIDESNGIIYGKPNINFFDDDDDDEKNEETASQNITANDTATNKTANNNSTANVDKILEELNVDASIISESVKQKLQVIT